MKLLTTTLASKAVLIFVLALIVVTTTSGQIPGAQKPILKPNAIANLIVGINSENEGVRKAAIYYAGKYEISQATDALIEQLKAEKKSSVQILIALALYKIGNEKGIEAIYLNSSLENDQHVKRMCDAIVEEYYANNNTYEFAKNFK